MELESKLKEYLENSNNECKSKINELLIQLQCEKESCSLEIEQKNTEILDKGIINIKLYLKYLKYW